MICTCSFARPGLPLLGHVGWRLDPPSTCGGDGSWLFAPPKRITADIATPRSTPMHDWMIELVVTPVRSKEIDRLLRPQQPRSQVRVIVCLGECDRQHRRIT